MLNDKISCETFKKCQARVHVVPRYKHRQSKFQKHAET